jgi:hypothetical protein
MEWQKLPEPDASGVWFVPSSSCVKIARQRNDFLIAGTKRSAFVSSADALWAQWSKLAMLNLHQFHSGEKVLIEDNVHTGVGERELRTHKDSEKDNA